MIVRRGTDYPGLRDSLRGKRVAVFTCNTCARLCNNVGGKDSAERLASQLRKDGIDALRVISVPAACIMAKVREVSDDPVAERCDVLLTLTCEVGEMCAGACFGKDTVNPLETLGTGYLDDNGVPTLSDGSIVMMGCTPFVE